MPQFFLSVAVLTQAVPHFVSSGGHCATQPPLTQTCPAEQTLSQVPQCCTSLLVSAQSPLQLVVPPVQTQLPAKQDAPPVQVTPHAPQLPASVCVLTHDPLHAVVPVGQLDWQ
jgi:hypothetical protein